MQEKYLYLSIDLLSFIFPFIASFYPKHSFFKTWKFLLPALFAVAIFFIIFDILYTKIGVWGFNERYLIGIKIVNLPLEEVLFFFLIPYSSLFIHFVLPVFIPKNPLIKYGKKISQLLFILSVIMSIYNYDKLYTLFTFGFLSLFFLIIILLNIDFSDFYFSYLFVLPFFFLTNGILTGSFIDEEVVRYNNNENINLRIGTIPVEDIFYGMLLIGMNCLLYEVLKKKQLRFFKHNFNFRK